MSEQQLDWKNLPFGFVPTNGFVQVDYADGQWGVPELKTDPMLSIHVAATCLHYGQSAFEGLKAFTTRDGEVVIFRPDMNSARINQSALRICMAEVPYEIFLEACMIAVRANRKFIPPYGTGASLYLRPLILGTEATVGISASVSYSFIVLVTPVGPYYKDGFAPVEAVVIDEYDRAAPCGTGKAKIGGNYAASLKPFYKAKELGFPIVLFTDPAQHKYVDEFGTSNFIGITKDGVYKTPASTSILESITNDSLQQLVRDMGIKVVKEPIALTDLGQFEEVGACGTAAVITPISAIYSGDTVYSFPNSGAPDGILIKLYTTLQGIQYGEIPDTHNWLVAVEF
ncbi:MAG: branched-chain amino acid aminotransferase [bacterium]